MHPSFDARPSCRRNEHSQRSGQECSSAHRSGTFCTCTLVSVSCLCDSLSRCKCQTEPTYTQTQDKERRFYPMFESRGFTRQLGNTKGQAGSLLIAAHSSPEWRLQYLGRSLYVTKTGLLRPIFVWVDGAKAREPLAQGVIP